MTPLNPDDLTVVLDIAADHWSHPSTIEATGAHHGYRQLSLVVDSRPTFPGLGWLLEPFQPVWAAWLSCIEPGGYVVPHIDAGPYRERWQVPITAAGTLNGQHHEVGVPFRVHHHDWHEVANDDPTPRVALVVDRDVLLGIPSQPFTRR